jgi:hypothetical protein
MKKLLAPIIIAFVSIFTASNASVKHLTLNAASPIADTSSQIPILAWIGVPQNQSTLARYQELSAAGITETYYPFSDANAVQTALDLSQKAGVKLIISCPELSRNPETIVKRFMNHPALGGYFLRDEPGGVAFTELGSLVKRIRAVDDNHICYVNLLPNYATPHQFGSNSYQEYLDAYTREVPIQILSFDHYPIIGITKPAMRGNWYSNLEMVSEASKRSGKPFWAFALTVAFTPYPDPTLAALRLQVYSNLAYGAQGIEYFTYWTVTNGGVDNFHNAPIARDGSKTATYSQIQQLNKEIKGLSGVFLGAKVVSVAHTGRNIPAGTKPLTQLPRSVSVLKTDGVGAVVSVLQKNNSSYLVIVNRDFTAPMNLTIKCNAGVSRISKDGSSAPQDQNTNTVKIEPGDAAIYKLN